MTENTCLRLRLAEPEDAAELLEIYAPYVKDTAITFEYEVPEVEEFAERIRRTQQRFPYLLAVKEGRIAGYAYVGPFHARPAYDWAVETSIYVRRELRGQGIGTRLYTALEQLLGDMGIRNLEACIAVPSQEDAHLTRASENYHAGRGFRLVGEFESCGYKFGRWYNMVWMEKHIGDHPSPAAPVRPFPEIREESCRRHGIEYRKETEE